MSVGAALVSLPIEVAQFSPGTLVADLVVDSADAVGVGDLLRLTFRAEGYVLMSVASAVEPAPVASPARGVVLRVTGGKLVWFKSVSSLPALPAQATAFTYQGANAPVSVLDSQFAQGKVTLDLDIAPSDAPVPGSLLRVDYGADQLWLTVQAAEPQTASGSPPGQMTRITGEGLWLASPPASAPSSLPAGERLTFELWVRHGSADSLRLGDLGFEASHPLYWGGLPTDEALFQNAQVLPVEARGELWQSASTPRFPLAGIADEAALDVPIAMPVLPDQFAGPDRLAASAQARDGLAAFDASVFLDPQLSGFLTEDLLSQADFLRYQSSAPRKLSGLHAALGIEEATLIAVPDAVQRGWHQANLPELPEPEKSAPLPHPEWWHSLGCNPPSEIPLAAEPPWEDFLDCGTRVIPPPQLFKSGDADATGTFTLFWSTQPDATYILEEATTPDFEDAARIYRGDHDRRVFYGHIPGIFYYRVRAEVNGASSNWSDGLAVRVVLSSPWLQDSEDDYSPDTLLAIHRVLLRACAARGDLFALLTLPEHYREAQAQAHVAALKSPYGVAITVGPSAVLPLGVSEARDFSFGAVYHPWLIGREENQPGELRRSPPDGAVCGVFARRALARGAWVAPANELLSGVVALSPFIARGNWQSLQDAQVNLVRHDPRGFLSLSADTLSDDPDLRPVNVRRLLMLLRRLALQLGATYVFEPNSDAFRRLVQRGFEAELERMFVRGAFAGPTPDTAFQVAVSNSMQDIDAGRFIVELRVAPSLPMRFLTVRLVQTGSRDLVVQEG